MNQSLFALLGRVVFIAAGLAIVTSTSSSAGVLREETEQTKSAPAYRGLEAIEKPALLSQWQQNWEAGVNMAPLINADRETTALIIQLEVLNKPATSYANAVYQLFVRRENKWVSVYTSTGARLLGNEAGSLALEPEVVPVGQLRRTLGENVDLANLELKAVVQVRYDLQGGAREQQLQLESTQNYAGSKPAASTAQTSPSTPSQTPSLPAQQSLTTTSQMMGRGQFSLAIRQPSGISFDTIARLSLKPRRSNGYLSERFIGDFRFKPNQRAQFMQGIYPGDRVVVRLYDLENRPIGYSEFELLFESAAVNLVVPAEPAQSRVVRTVYGMDANADGSIDPGTVIYDYFTKITEGTAGSKTVTFLTNLETIDTSRFQAEGLLAPPRTSIYTPSLESGAFSVANRTTDLFSADLAPALTAQPAQVTQVINLNDSGTSTYQVSQLMSQYRDEGVSPRIQVRFPDVPADHWAKDFIAELAAKEILKGFLDGAFRPNEPVTRAEFAAMIRKAFNKPKSRTAVAFPDVPATHWAAGAIREAYEMGFFEGGNFNPDKKLDRLDILVILSKGLNYSAKAAPDGILQVYSDAGAIPGDVRNLIAGATEQGLVVNYPALGVLNPQKLATRAEVAAFLYQALVSTGDVAKISSPYVVGGAGKASDPKNSPNQP